MPGASSGSSGSSGTRVVDRADAASMALPVRMASLVCLPREEPRRMDPMISSDSHIVEPPDLWEKWLAPEFRPRAPKLVKDEEGGDAWLYNDGGAPAPLGLVTVTRGRPREELRWSGAHYDTINQGNFEGSARVKEMLEDGVVAEVIYSPQRTMRHFMLGTEDDFQLAGIRAYNDWLAKDFCAKAPDRLIGLAQMPSVGVEAGVPDNKRTQ